MASNLRVWWLIPLLLIVVILCPFSYGKVIYVDDDAVGSNDGTNWENAYTFLQDALTDAESADKPVEIRVAQGTYTPDKVAGQTPGDRKATFQLINVVTLAGGYAGIGIDDPNVRDFELYETILSGDLDDNDVDVNDPNNLLDEPTRAENSYHIVTGSETDYTAVLDGFTITAGNANGTSYTIFGHGGGISNNINGNPTLTNCTFIGNSAYYGGGMYYTDSNPILNHCTFSGNVARNHGGGLCNQNWIRVTMADNPTFTNNTLSGNMAEYYVGRIYINSMTNSLLTNCTFSGNFAGDSGGGIYVHYNSSFSVTNCTFTENFSPHGNSVSSISYSYEDPSIVQLNNCILWDYDNEIWNEDGSTITIIYSDIRGGQNNVYDPYEKITWGIGNIDADPLFADPGYWADVNDPNIAVEPNNPNAIWIEGDYHLKSQAGRWDPVSESWVVDDVTNPCIDAGDPNSPIGYEPFPNGGIINMGAYGGTEQASLSLSTVDSTSGPGDSAIRSLLRDSLSAQNKNNGIIPLLEGTY